MRCLCNTPSICRLGLGKLLPAPSPAVTTATYLWLFHQFAESFGVRLNTIRNHGSLHEILERMSEGRAWHHIFA